MDYPKRIKMVPVCDIMPSPENDKVYTPADISTPDAALKELAADVATNGILDPLVITKDHYVVSGHRRLAAAKIAGLQEVPVRVCRISRSLNHDKFMRLLVSHNKQRSKSFDEKTREAIISAMDKEEVYAAMIEHREKSADMPDGIGLDLGDWKPRDRISDAKGPFVQAAKEVIESLKKWWPVTVRQVHYGLVSMPNPPLRHASKPDSTYRNDPQSYKSLTDLLTRMRVEGHIPYSVISDGTRSVTQWPTRRDVGDFLASAMNNLLHGYWRDLMQSQPCHIEIDIEKNTLINIVKPIAARYTIPMLSLRGQSSNTAIYQLAERFRKSGKEKLLLLMVSDLDPEGEVIARNVGRRLRDEFSVNVTAHKVAITPEHVKQFSLPPLAVAKEGSSRRAAYVAEHGEHVYEVEALKPSDLEEILTAEIDRVIDRDAFNRELSAEREDAAQLECKRREILQLLAT